MTMQPRMAVYPDEVKADLVMPVVVDVRLMLSLLEGLTPIPYTVYQPGEEPDEPPEGWQRYSHPIELPMTVTS